MVGLLNFLVSKNSRALYCMISAGNFYLTRLCEYLLVRGEERRVPVWYWFASATFCVLFRLLFLFLCFHLPSKLNVISYCFVRNGSIRDSHDTCYPSL